MAKTFSEKLLAESVRQLQDKKSSLEAKLREYKTLERDLLETSKVSSKQVMIPLSGVGFVPGRLVHTNEVYVHLGANYFVQRTAHECSGIIERREKLLSEQLAQVEQALSKQLSLQNLKQGE